MRQGKAENKDSRTMLPEFRLDGQVALVTGAMGLIGKEVSDAGASAGADLVLADVRPQQELDEQSNALSDYYGNLCLGVQMDVSDIQSVQEMVSRAIRNFGKIDVLIHCAAIDAKFDASMGDVPPTGFEVFPLDLWQKSVDVNMTGTFLVTQAIVGEMLKRRRGNIISVASTYSLVAPDQSLYHSAETEVPLYKPVDYVATKSFIPNFTRYIATLYARQGIRANCIVPHGIWNEHPDWFVRNFEKRSPMGRMCRVSELRGPFIFLASEASSYMTGSTLVVDGGWTAW